MLHTHAHTKIDWVVRCGMDAGLRMSVVSTTTTDSHVARHTSPDDGGRGGLRNVGLWLYTAYCLGLRYIQLPWKFQIVYNSALHTDLFTAVCKLDMKNSVCLFVCLFVCKSACISVLRSSVYSARTFPVDFVLSEGVLWNIVVFAFTELWRVANLPVRMLLEWVVLVRRCCIDRLLGRASCRCSNRMAGTCRDSSPLRRATEQRNTPYVGFWTCPVYGIPFEIGWNTNWQSRLLYIIY
jgi:hypothetical protein